jgi:hypothetical protein
MSRSTARGPWILQLVNELQRNPLTLLTLFVAYLATLAALVVITGLAGVGVTGLLVGAAIPAVRKFRSRRQASPSATHNASVDPAERSNTEPDDQ